LLYSAYSTHGKQRCGFNLCQEFHKMNNIKISMEHFSSTLKRIKEVFRWIQGFIEGNVAYDGEFKQMINIADSICTIYSISECRSNLELNNIGINNKIIIINKFLTKNTL
jgi:hypothetical protein